MDFKGMRVIYRSGSGKEYEAIITHVRREVEWSKYPIVSLIFKDIRGKWKKKDSVLPMQSPWHTTQVWKYDKGKYAWKDGLFVDEETEK